MPRPERPTNEVVRIAALRRAQILDTPTDQAFDDLIRIAASICRVPMAAVSLVDVGRQWLKARLGIAFDQTPRDDAFCAHAILDPQRTLVVEDARTDPRFCDNPLVLQDDGIRFYAGAPLLDPQGLPLGSFCVMDHAPRRLEPEQQEALEALSRQASRLIELHRLGRELDHHLRERDWYEQQLVQYQDELERQNADLVEMARIDPLTGLHNRRAFALALEEAAQAGGRYAVAICDIDHFKTINDVHGHAEGDRVLRAVADALREQHAARGRVARLGGEEFILLFPGASADDAALQCEFLRQAIASLPLGLPLTVSIGVAEGRADDAPDAVTARADAALYAAKRGGRDQVRVG